MLAVEPLATMIREFIYITEFIRDDTEQKCVLYADNTSLFLEDNTNSLQHLITMIHKFELFSRLDVNWDEAALLPLNPRKEPLPAIASSL